MFVRKPYISIAAVAAITVGTSLVLRPHVPVIDHIMTALSDPSGDVWMSETVKQQLQENGKALVTFASGAELLLIDPDRLNQNQ